MERVTLTITASTIGLDQFQASIGSVDSALATCGGAPIEIEGEGLAITFMGAPLVEIAAATRTAPGEVIMETSFRPAGGLGLLVGIANLRCSPRVLRTRWEDGWPVVELLPETEALEVPRPGQD